MLSTAELLPDAMGRRACGYPEGNMMRPVRALLVFCIALLLVACGGSQAQGDFTRPVRGGSAVRFDRQDLTPTRWRIRSNLHIQLHVQHQGQTETVGGGVDRLFDTEALGPERDGSARAKVDIRAWNDSTPDPSTPRAGRSYIVERVGPELRFQPIAGGPISPGEQQELAKLHRSFGKATDTELSLAGRSLRPGDVVPFVQEDGGAVVQGQIRLLGMTRYGGRPVAEFELVGVASEVREGISVRADLRGVLLIDPPSSQTLMMDVEGPARAHGGALEATGRSHSIATATPL